MKKQGEKNEEEYEGDAEEDGTERVEQVGSLEADNLGEALQVVALQLLIESTLHLISKPLSAEFQRPVGRRW